MKKNFFRYLLLKLIFLFSTDAVALIANDFSIMQNSLAVLSDIYKKFPKVLDTKYKTFFDWQLAYKEAPFNIDILESKDLYFTDLTLNEFDLVLDEFFKTMNPLLKTPNLWVENKSPSDEFFNINEEVFQPFAQKLVVDPESIIAFHGDFHGDIHSLISYINFLKDKGYLDDKDPFLIKDKNFYMIFLGDYVDRGRYGLEVLYTLMRLKIKNPDKVFIIRGNHEDPKINDHYGFFSEFSEKFKDILKDEVKLKEYFKKISRMYDFMPVVLYLGSGDGSKYDFIQCCHGGMEIGYNPQNLLESNEKIKFQLLEDINRLTEFQNLLFNSTKKSSINIKMFDNFKLSDVATRKTGLGKYVFSEYFYLNIGFMWNDFIVDENNLFDFMRGRGFKYGKLMTQAVLKRGSSDRNILRGVFRAHQHTSSLSPMMTSILENEKHPGLSKLWKSEDDLYDSNKLWDGIVCTFLVAPDTAYSKKGTLYNYDAFCILKTEKTFDQWNIDLHRIELKKNP